MRFQGFFTGRRRVWAGNTPVSMVKTPVAMTETGAAAVEALAAMGNAAVSAAVARARVAHSDGVTAETPALASVSVAKMPRMDADAGRSSGRAVSTKV